MHIWYAKPLSVMVQMVFLWLRTLSFGRITEELLE
jgi:hypothetical protein